MVTYQQSTARVGFYCKRCKRQLRTRICPLHGVDSTIILETTAHLPLPPAGESFASMTPANKEDEAPPWKDAPPPNGNGTRGDFADQLFSDLLQEAEAATDRPDEMSPPGDAPGEPTTAAEAPPRIPLGRLHQKHRPRGIGLAITVLLVLASGITFYSFNYPEYARTSLFGQAERLFAAGEYPQALSSYQKFAQKYPGDAQLPTVMNRIEEIEKITAEQEKQAQWLAEMMAKATRAFQEDRLITPRENNAYRYLEEILREMPSYPPAVALQNRLVVQLFDRASRAFEQDRFHEALNYYKRILAMRPGDAAVSAQINRALELKNVDEMLRNLGELAEARAEIRRLRQQRARLKAEIRQARHRLSDLSSPPAAPPAASQTSALPPRPQSAAPASEPVASLSAVVPASEPEPRRNDEITTAPALPEKSEPNPFQPVTAELGIEMLFQDATEAESAPAADEPQIVEETLIDGGKKTYLHREKPKLPEGYRTSEMPMILAECLVGTDGRVEAVTLVSGAEDKLLNELAVEAFKKFRYQPATHQGRPVRFKALEVLAF